jgi:hypothetical protein
MGSKSKWGFGGFFQTFCDLDSLFSSCFFFNISLFMELKKYHRPSLGTPITMKIAQKGQEMNNIWVMFGDGHDYCKCLILHQKKNTPMILISYPLTST